MVDTCKRPINEVGGWKPALKLPLVQITLGVNIATGQPGLIKAGRGQVFIIGQAVADVFV